MIGDTIKYFREKSGMSQQELAEELGLARSSIATWEINKNCPSLENITTLCRIFNISSDRLLGIERTVGAYTPISEEERNIISLYRELNDKGRQMILDTLTAYSLSGMYQKKQW